MSVIENVKLEAGIILITKNGQTLSFKSPHAIIEQFILWHDRVIVRENYMESVGPEIYAIDSDLNILWHANRLEDEDCYANEMRVVEEGKIRVSSFKGWVFEIDLSSGKTFRKGWTK
ncbi:MAG: hypothetical protein EOP48_00155 [Sphingobacteriales bacterium]|nr:MAG: hypothetical protein EOP48_00155 [Sphingobacteriales bacterium]